MRWKWEHLKDAHNLFGEKQKVNKTPMGIFSKLTKRGLYCHSDLYLEPIKSLTLVPIQFWMNNANKPHTNSGMSRPLGIQWVLLSVADSCLSVSAVHSEIFKNTSHVHKPLTDDILAYISVSALPVLCNLAFFRFTKPISIGLLSPWLSILSLSAQLCPSPNQIRTLYLRLLA